MQFNKFVWQLYRESTGGKKVLEQWDYFKAKENEVTDLFREPTAPDSQTTSALNEDSAAVTKAAKDYADKFEVSSLADALEVFETMVRSGLPVMWPEAPAEAETLTLKEIIDFIWQISLGLHLAHPDYFIPYEFATNFDTLERISEQFGLALPPLPGKRDEIGRALFYAQILETCHEFRAHYDLSVVEVCAFLYNFAPHFVKDGGDLPAPSKVWPVIAGAYSESDFEWIEAATKSDTAPWHGNVDVRRGDVLLMYCVTPYKRIHSVWRAVSDGFNDPFSYYYSTVWIGHPIKTAPVTFREMRTHSLLAQSAVIRTNMQGPNSGSFTLEEYEAILDIMASKGQDTSLLPKPQTVSYLPSEALENERDVETELVEPLLERLGYTPDNWLRQMPLRMGRGERIYPDYVFGANQTRGEESAAMVLEAKFSISREKDLQEAYFQMNSYALRLQAKVAVLAAREGIWVFPRKRGSFGLGYHTHYTWDDLTHPDVLHKLGTLISF